MNVENLISEAAASGGAERANYQIFISGLCDVLGVSRPQMSREENARNDYVFERSLDCRHPDGSITKLFVDCYKRGNFVLEAKQSATRQRPDPRQTDMFGSEGHSRRQGHARRGSRGWDRVMRAANLQAVDYTRRLPVEHGYPPFVVLVDVGNVIELYADFSGQGKNYAQFPDAQDFRITMEDLRKPEIQARLRAVWTDPYSLDPTRKSAEVTRDIADRLARIAKNLEGKYDARDVAEFLMRCLFTMFAEDVGLLPKRILVDMLERLVDHPDAFAPALESLWKTMNDGGFEPHSMASLKYFNGGLFATPRALPLAPEDIHELLVAARQNWQDVEPAIFGTLLERALNPRERSRLGAHYTPRVYVERLVVPTIIDPLREKWMETQAQVEDRLKYDDKPGALKFVRDFHRYLCSVRVLDPACGTGNFLYVALELMKRLEGEVLAALEELGEQQSQLLMDGHTVSPRQFYGLELNPRAVAIADLVLWIGYLKWQLKTVGINAIPEPILHRYGTIKHQDAILAYDAETLLRDDKGTPVTRWDGLTRISHPITGELVPDPEARIEVYTYKNPRPADWPEVEFIVGNPPFIGGKDMRAELGDGYAEAAWKARPAIPGGADFVMHFWDEAARRLTRKGDNPLRRFGFITTNSITQTFSRRVIEQHMASKSPLSLIFAIPDHPWMKATDKAAVRIAMTVAEAGERDGKLARVISESALDTDTPLVALEAKSGTIQANLTIGANLSFATPLLAAADVSRPGVKLHGAGFIVSKSEALKLGLGKTPGLENYIRPYLNGKDIASRPRESLVIDMYPLSEKEVSTRFPEVFQYLVDAVKPERDNNRDKDIRANWWVFGRVRTELRDLLEGLPRYITTIETAKHRFFQFLDASVRPDNRLVNVGTSAAEHLALLGSRTHVAWALATGGQLEDRPIYTKTQTFDPFAFPDLSTATGLRLNLSTLGERLDAFRKERLAAHPFLTMTGLYNLLERVRELEWKAGPGRHSDSAADITSLTDKERDIYDAGHIAVLKDIHDEIDQLVFAAYGYNDLAERLIGMPGATTPSPYKTADQQATEEELLTRLVALNQERAAEEASGLVRWLRPDYQIPRLGHKTMQPGALQQEADLDIVPVIRAPKWPANSDAQLVTVLSMLRNAPAPLPPESLIQAFGAREAPKRRQRIESLLETLTSSGLARSGILDGQRRYFISH